MGPIKIRTLRNTDAESLLKFELDNRQWFEHYIDARDSAFYSLQGVTEHITSYLSDFANGTWHPFVIEDSDGKIIGRANLKSINNSEGSAEVGYRIAAHACGQGLATLAVRRMIEEAQSRWSLTRLVANVHTANIGSTKVLQRCGFLIGRLSGQEEVKDDIRFVLSI